MHIVVMNNGNFIATSLRTVVQCIMHCETTTNIYSACKFNILIYVHYVIFFGLCFINFFGLLVLFDLYLEFFVRSWNKCVVETQFISQNICKQKQLYFELPLYLHLGQKKFSLCFYTNI